MLLKVEILCLSGSTLPQLLLQRHVRDLDLSLAQIKRLDLALPVISHRPSTPPPHPSKPIASGPSAAPKASGAQGRVEDCEVGVSSSTGRHTAGQGSGLLENSRPTAVIQNRTAKG